MLIFTVKLMTSICNEVNEGATATYLEISYFLLVHHTCQSVRLEILDIQCF